MNTKGFFEMEMVTLDDIYEFENELKNAGIEFESDKHMMNDHLASSYSCYADFEGTDYADEELLCEESYHGFNNLKAVYEERYEK